MDNNEEKKAKIVKLVTESAKPRRKRAPRTKPPVKTASVLPSGHRIIVNSKGDAQVAGGDININTKKIERNTITPPPGSLAPAEAKRVQDAIAKLVDIETATGALDGDRRKLFAKWYSAVRRHFSVPSYHFIPSHRCEEALDWLRQSRATKRRKLKRADPQAWRNEHFRAIWARAGEIAMSKADVYALILDRFGKRVLSLKQLSDQDLRKLYVVIFGMRRS